METALEKSEIELDKESVEQVRKLFDDYVVDPLGTKLLDSEKRLKGDEAERVEQLKQDLAPKLSRTNAYLEGLIQAFGNPKDPLANLESQLDNFGAGLENNLEDDFKDKLDVQNEALETSLTNHLETLHDSLCSDLTENTSRLSEQSDAEQKAVLEKLAALEQQLLTKLENGSTQMTAYHNSEAEALSTQNETLETSLIDHLETLHNLLCSDLTENTSQLSEQSAAEQKAVLERFAALEQQLLAELGNNSVHLTEYLDNTKKEAVEYQETQQAAMRKYRLMLGASLAFGIVNFLGIMFLLFLNFMT
jgi:23S rRNA U2552 (ribose-2'-O)-methylase RlmE/FtsJ